MTILILSAIALQCLLALGSLFSAFCDIERLKRKLDRDEP